MVKLKAGGGTEKMVRLDLASRGTPRTAAARYNHTLRAQVCAGKSVGEESYFSPWASPLVGGHVQTPLRPGACTPSLLALLCPDLAH